MLSLKEIQDKIRSEWLRQKRVKWLEDQLLESWKELFKEYIEKITPQPKD